MLKNYKKSIKFNRKAVKYFARAKDTSKLVNSLILQANLNYYNFKNKKEAYRLLDSILTIDIKSNNFKNILKNQVYQSYGIFNYYDTNFKESYKNYYQALSYLKNPKTKIDSVGLANSYANISEVCMELKKYELSKKYNDSVDNLITVLDANLKSFHLQNKLRLSYETQKNFSEVSTNLNTLNRSMNKNYEKRISNELTALKQANKKEKELLVTNQKVTLHNSELKNKQILLFSVLGFLVLSTFIGILYYRQRKLRFQKEEIFMQQRLFRAQMNPHFTSNILYTIQDLILENKEKANKYLIKFSRLLRLNLENSMQNYTLIEKEIEVLTKYLDLQQLRFPNKFNYQINTHDLEVDLGTTILDGNVQFDYDSNKLEFLNASETIDIETDTSLTFNYYNLEPFETRIIDINFTVFTIPTVNIGDIINFTATVNPTIEDYTIEDNVLDFDQTVVGSYDPNDIHILEGPQIRMADSGKYLHYLIRFENTGTADVINIVVKNKLDANLDWTSLQLEKMSHDGRVEILEGNQIKFIFDDIHLPSDETNSHGYIAYKIKPKYDIVIGDIIKNQASIYFDFNPAINTNIARTEIVNNTASINDISLSSLVNIYPNPTNGTLHIETESIQIINLKVYSNFGQLVMSKNDTNINQIDLSKLLNGLYFIKLEDKNGNIIMKKVLVK